MRKISSVIITVMMLLSTFVLAQTEGLADPGMTPDNPLYFLDEVSDLFQAEETVTDEKAAEIVAMAEKGNEKALAKAIQKYDKALLKQKKKAYLDEEKTAKVAQQVSKHLAALAKVLEQVPEAAKPSVEEAMKKSAKGMTESFKELKALNEEKGKQVAAETLQKDLAQLQEILQELFVRFQQLLVLPFHHSQFLQPEIDRILHLKNIMDCPGSSLDQLILPFVLTQM